MLLLTRLLLGMSFLFIPLTSGHSWGLEPPKGLDSRKNLSQSALYYNLGVSQETRDKPGEALLWYLRSARLNPSNPLVRQGIERTLPEGNSFPLPWRMALWNRYLGFPLMAWGGLISWWIFWIFLGLGTLGKGKKSFFFRSWAKRLAIPALLLGGMVLWNIALETLAPLGVVTEKECVLRSGYSSNATPLFSLPEGSVLRILRKEGAFSLVATPGGHRGWTSGVESIK
jgi:hypothetical protein